MGFDIAPCAFLPPYERPQVTVERSKNMNIDPTEVMAAACAARMSMSECCNLNMICAATPAQAGGPPSLPRMKVRRGTHLYCPGDTVGGRLYAVHSGSFKVYVPNQAAQATIVRFPVRGDFMGLESAGRPRHCTGAIALEDSYVCEVQCHASERPCPRFNHALSREIALEQKLGARLRPSGADRRLALFLLSVGTEFARLGYSPTRYRLAMARSDIANYLGLTPECVSRALLRMQLNGLLALSGREVRLLDTEILHTLANQVESRQSGDGESGVRQPAPAHSHCL
jgi:CRP/FNR family transcriptional regulator, anaerobic regulatory protein